MAILANKSFTQNVLDRVLLVLDAAGPTAITIDDIINPITGSSITVLDSAEAAVTFPDALTQTPGNNLSWYSREYIIQTSGEFVVVFNPDVGANFVVPLLVNAGSIPAPSLQTCNIEDHVVDAQGVGIENVTVSARVLSPPAVQSGAGLSIEVVTTQTDSSGFFRITLLRNVFADVIIPFIGYRRTITVPDQAQVNLFSIV